MNRPGFHTITLGCKLNQFDSAAIEGALERRGLTPEPDPRRAGVVVINTCTVTHRADAEARKLIRRIRRGNPSCRLLVTGCYAELDAQAIRSVGGVDHIFGNRDKSRVDRILDRLGIGQTIDPGTSPEPPASDRGCDGALQLPQALHFGERSRAFLKIQEGCRLACSYCIIPQVRGPSRSVAPDQIVKQALALFRRGYHEIVLTGVNTGDYGRDLAPSLSLTSLLERLLEVCDSNRIRLNSLEPLTIDDRLIGLMAAERRIAPHLQVPLQSGSSAILRLMRRNYRLRDYARTLARLRDAVPDIGLGADVIVGFPGETDPRFAETIDFIADSPLSYLHVFAWSPRPGTPAADLEGRVAPAIIRQRSAELRRLGDRLSRRFAERFRGRCLEAVVLGPRPEDGLLRALTGNFIEVLLEPSTATAGALLPVRIERVANDGVRATRQAGHQIRD